MKPSIPKGTRDFSPQEVVKRNYIFDTIRQVFKLYGYLPIETPSMENIDTLMGKYGEEGDRLIFKILNSGNYFSEFKDDTEIIEAKNKGEQKFTRYISEKALRYDLTVPFARYVVMHQNEITFPFKRYQIQPVWRADRPQKGRYREFYQCDADVIGSDSLLNEVELIQIINDVFTRLGIPVVIKLNNRKILQGIAEVIGAPDRMIDIAIAIDKLDKIGESGVVEELKEKGFSGSQIELLRLVLTSGVSMDSLKKGEYYNQNERFKKCFDEMDSIIVNSSALSALRSPLRFDISLARGLNYYTGTIIEVKADSSVSNFTGSICGGGRYDDLTGIFGLPNMSGVGISFGADRIYDVMEELGLFPADVTTSTRVMFVNFGEAEARHCLTLVGELHKAGISAELYPDAAKFKKQMSYADNKKVAYVAFVGADEITKNVVKLKNMASGEEKEIPVKELINAVK